MVAFDGTNDYLERGAGLTGASDSNNGMSVYLKINTTDSSFRVFDDPLNRLRLRVLSSGKLDLRIRDSGGLQVCTVRSNTAINTGSDVEIWMTYDGAAGTSAVYVDGVDDTDDRGTSTSSTVDWTETDFYIFTSGGGSDLYTGDAEIYRVWDSAKDLSSSSVRADMADTTDVTSAIVAFQGAASDWNAGTNHGTGGDFTMNGAVV